MTIELTKFFAPTSIQELEEDLGGTKCAKEVPIHSQLGPYFKEKRIYKATICRKKGNYQKELDKLFLSSINTNPNEFWKNLNPLKFVESYACSLHTTAVTS